MIKCSKLSLEKIILMFLKLEIGIHKVMPDGQHVFELSEPKARNEYKKLIDLLGFYLTLKIGHLNADLVIGFTDSKYINHPKRNQLPYEFRLPVIIHGLLQFSQSKSILAYSTIRNNEVTFMRPDMENVAGKTAIFVQPYTTTESYSIMNKLQRKGVKIICAVSLINNTRYINDKIPLVSILNQIDMNWFSNECPICKT